MFWYICITRQIVFASVTKDRKEIRGSIENASGHIKVMRSIYSAILTKNSLQQSKNAIRELVQNSPPGYFDPLMVMPTIAETIVECRTAMNDSLIPVLHGAFRLGIERTVLILSRGNIPRKSSHGVIRAFRIHNECV